MIGFTVSFLLLLGLLTLVSYVDRLYTEIGKFLSRDFQDNIDAFEHNVEPRLSVSRARAALRDSHPIRIPSNLLGLLSEIPHHPSDDDTSERDTRDQRKRR